jgi:hypothetical protein
MPESLGSDESKMSQMETHAQTLVQSRKLSGIQKDSASEMKNILRKWNTDAYESIDSGWHASTMPLKNSLPSACSRTTHTHTLHLFLSSFSHALTRLCGSLQPSPR